MRQTHETATTSFNQLKEITQIMQAQKRSAQVSANANASEITRQSTLTLKVDASEITWLKHTDFNALKLKVSLSIVAISAIFLLKRYMSLEDVLSSIPKDTPLSHNPIFWQVVIHLVFVCSALLAAVTNNIAFSQNKGH